MADEVFVMDWRNHFEKTAAAYAETDFLRQVAKTVGGVPITEDQLLVIVSSLIAGLELRAKDRLLDLCCGNGLLSKYLAQECDSVFGIDFSKTLLAVANKHNQLKNIQYAQASVLELEEVISLTETSFSRVCMYEALQCFDEADFPRILDTLIPLCAGNAILFFGSVPDIDLIWEFYNTEERRAEYYARLEEGTEAIGTWWNRQYLENIAHSKGFTVKFKSQNPALHTAHYRFDFILKFD